VRCTDPFVYAVKGSSLIQADWDTIITREYLKGFQPPVVSDTFITNTGDILLIEQSRVTPKDFEITLPSISKTYKLTNLTLNQRSEQQYKRHETGCYNSVSYTLDGRVVNEEGTKLVYIPLER
jgi:hypothetical protein